MKTSTKLRLNDLFKGTAAWRRGFRVTYLSGEHQKLIHMPSGPTKGYRWNPTHRNPDVEIVLMTGYTFRQYRNKVLSSVFECNSGSGGDNYKVKVSRGILPIWMVRTITDRDIECYEDYQRRHPPQRRVRRLVRGLAGLPKRRRAQKQSDRELLDLYLRCRLLRIRFSGDEVERVGNGSRLFEDHSLWPDEFEQDSDWMRSHSEAYPIRRAMAVQDQGDVYFLLTAGDIDLDAYCAKVDHKVEIGDLSAPEIDVVDNVIWNRRGKATRLKKRSRKVYGNTYY